MALSVLAEGDQVAVVGTEQSLVIDNTNHIYILEVDLVNMAASDTVQLRVKVKTRLLGNLNGAADHLTAFATFSNAQTDPTPSVVTLGPVAANYYYEATLKQTAGTARTFPWKVTMIA